MPVHEVRRDVPQVLSEVIDKLLAKNPDVRYQSAHGLKADLLECQRRLLAAVSSASEQSSSELISRFEIGLQDNFSGFTLPIALFGREKELDTIRNVIRHASTTFSRHVSASKGFITISSSGSQEAGTSACGDENSDAMSSTMSDHSPGQDNFRGRPPASHDQSMSSSMSVNSSNSPSGALRRSAFSSANRPPRTQAVVIVGPPGAGKSSMVVANQAKWRAHGLWGHVNFQSADSAPFEVLLGCLSSVLRQLMVFQNDIQQFVRTLKHQLGPQLQNVPLLYQAAPELKDILERCGVTEQSPPEALSSTESRARFKSLIESIFSVISETRLFALFLDDLHEADESSLDLAATLLNSRSRMLIFATLRSDRPDVVERVRAMFTKWSTPTWINVENLDLSSISALVSKALHRSKEDSTPLSEFVYTASQGNAFAARNILISLHRQKHITYDAAANHWKSVPTCLLAFSFADHCL
jgi:hypothetical protein